MTGNVDNIKIRMYNTGSVGDCILLLFCKDTDISFSMLIDCGGIKTSADAINPCVSDIAATCKHQLDLLIVTHQHEDHISGFNLARALFDQITVKETWMSWVEDPTDPIAGVVKDKFGKRLRQLQEQTERAQAHLQRYAKQTSDALGFGKRYAQHQASLDAIKEQLEFEAGDTASDRGARAANGTPAPTAKNAAAKTARAATAAASTVTKGLTNNDAMEYVRKKGRTIAYRLPGEVIKNLPGAEGIKFYILGPPRDPDLSFLKIEMDTDEMYQLALGTVPTPVPPTQRLTASGITLRPQSSPFDAGHQLSGKEEAAFWRQYGSDEMKWRQIELDWVGTGDVSLALTRFVNNTSLAMALEFEDSGRVVLLPADAQSGNWMSWHKPDVSDTLKTNGGKDTNELLAATVFYKVGHHGSHNGTASHSGLDLVTSPSLVAFMPLVQDKVPLAWGGAANFPAEQLYGALIEKTKGRVVRTDVGLIDDPRAQRLRGLLPAADINAFTNAFRKGSCYVEYTINGK